MRYAHRPPPIAMETLTSDFCQQLKSNTVRWVNTKLLSDARNESPNSNTENLHKHKDYTQ